MSLNEIPLPRLPHIPGGKGCNKVRSLTDMDCSRLELPNWSSALQCGFMKLSVASNG